MSMGESLPSSESPVSCTSISSTIFSSGRWVVLLGGRWWCGCGGGSGVQVRNSGCECGAGWWAGGAGEECGGMLMGPAEVGDCDRLSPAGLLTGDLERSRASLESLLELASGRPDSDTLCSPCRPPGLRRCGLGLVLLDRRKSACILCK